MERLLTIYRSKQSAFIVWIVGFSILAFGVFFLYLNFLSPYNFYRLLAIISLVLSLVVLYSAFNFLKVPLIVASEDGIKLNIALFGKSIFIPWEGVSEIGAEFKDPLPTWGSMSARPLTKCLVFEIGHMYLNKIPLFLKGVLKAKNKIYFSSLSLLVDDANIQLLALKNKNFQSVFNCGVICKSKKRRFADLILLLMLVSSGALSLVIDFLVIQYPNVLSNKFFTEAGKVIDLIGRVLGTGNIKQRGAQENYGMALFFIPFCILAAISFAIYFKLLKGKIKDE